MKTRKHLVQMLLLLAVIFCISAPLFAANDLVPFTGMKGTLRIAGGTAHIPVMKEAARRIISFNPDIRITIAGGGSGLGIKQAGEGLIDIGNAGRRPTDAEIEKFGLKLFQWAIDGIGVIVNPKNQVRDLTGRQLRDIFAGQITNWKEVGGVNRGINLYSRDESSGTRKVFWKKALAKGPISAMANIVVSNGAMKTAIAGDPFGIGFVSVGHIDATVAPVSLDGDAPDLANIRSGEYRVTRGLYSLTRGEPRGLAKAFIVFLFSPTGQQIVRDRGFIAVR